jgi:hypothetical protein
MIKTIFISALTVMSFAACKTSRLPEQPEKTILEANTGGNGPEIVFDFTKGKEHNHPSFVLWAEDMDGHFIQTLFITVSMGKGVFEHGDPSSGKWLPGAIPRPAALPYWAHRRGIKGDNGLYVPSPKNPIPDAYTGATPAGSFELTTRFDKEPPRKFRILFEINQTWDWNEYWTNNRYPDEEEYKTSCQPALVYAVTVDMDNLRDSYELQLIGHSHYSGETGELFTDLATITTAMEIADKMVVKVIRP